MLVMNTFQGVSFKAKFTKIEKNYFMKAAKEASLASTCARANTGAVVVKDKEIIGSGRSYTPEGIDSCKTLGSGCIRNRLNIPSGKDYDKTCKNVHAEINALSRAGFEKSKGASLFLWGYSYLCDNCLTNTKNYGITDVYIQMNEKSKMFHYKVKQLVSVMNIKYRKGLEELGLNLNNAMKH